MSSSIITPSLAIDVSNMHKYRAFFHWKWLQIVILTFTLVGGQQKENAVINVYTSNWTDEKKSLKIAKVIRNLGIKEELKYKPDLYTYFDIYRDGDFKLWPTVYRVPEASKNWHRMVVQLLPSPPIPHCFSFQHYDIKFFNSWIMAKKLFCYNFANKIVLFLC